MRCLIVSPHFPPSNAADMQRVRMLLPYFYENGIEAEVLSVEPEQTTCPMDGWLEGGLPRDLPIHRVQALGLKWANVPGLGTLGFRALQALGRRGAKLLSSKNFDLVYFSTTVSEVHILGPRWKRKFGVPFVLDYQDPWVNDYYREHPDVVPPGGRFKYAVVDFLHRRMEPYVVRHCSGITSVSRAYPAQLAQRYPWLKNLPALVQPFPAEARDYERVAPDTGAQLIFSPEDRNIHWVYAGVVIPAMHGVLRALFRSLRDDADQELFDRLRLHFIGTCYATGEKARAVVLPVAKECGLEALVEEHPQRIPYSQVLACLHKADALMIIGSDDPGYTASKIYPYILARKPLLAVFHEQSYVVQLFQEVGGGVCVPFSDNDSEYQLADRIYRAWLESHQHKIVAPLRADALEPFTGATSARILTNFFTQIVGSTGA